MSFRSITSTTSGPCACCGLGNVVMSCRTRGGTAVMVGCEVFTTPDLPPKKYRKYATTGVNVTNTYAVPPGSCAGAPTVVTTCTYNGILQYDPVTGLPSASGGTDCVDTLGGHVFTPQPTTCPTAADFVDNCLISWTLGETTADRACTGSCCVNNPGVSERKCISDSFVGTLSDEETEADAIARLLAGAGGTWSAYTTVGDGSGGTCLAESCCQAHWQQRTTGFSIAYQEAQFKAVISALDPLTNYVVTFKVYRRLQGSSDPWVLLLDSPYAFTSDASGNYTITDEDIPNLEGYETYICCPFIYKP